MSPFSIYIYYSVCNFFENSPKRQKKFKCFLEFYKVDLNLPETKRKEIIRLVKTRWVERAKQQFSLLSQAKNKNLYDDFYKHLEENYYENWTWDAEIKIKAQGLFAATKLFEHILAFCLVFNGLEPLKPLVTKMQKCSQDIYKAYQMIDNAISKLKDFRHRI